MKADELREMASTLGNLSPDKMKELMKERFPTATQDFVDLFSQNFKNLSTTIQSMSDEDIENMSSFVRGDYTNSKEIEKLSTFLQSGASQWNPQQLQAAVDLFQGANSMQAPDMQKMMSKLNEIRESSEVLQDTPPEDSRTSSDLDSNLQLQGFMNELQHHGLGSLPEFNNMNEKDFKSLMEKFSQMASHFPSSENK